MLNILLRTALFSFLVGAAVSSCIVALKLKI